METGTVPTKENWQPIEWGNKKVPGVGFEIEPTKRGNRKAKWAFTLVLPAEAKSFSVDYEESEYGPNRRHNDRFVVKYQTADTEETKVITVPLGYGDRRIERDRFSVRLQS